MSAKEQNLFKKQRKINNSTRSSSQFCRASLLTLPDICCFTISVKIVSINIDQVGENRLFCLVLGDRIINVFAIGRLEINVCPEQNAYRTNSRLRYVTKYVPEWHANFWESHSRTLFID